MNDSQPELNRRSFISTVAAVATGAMVAPLVVPAVAKAIEPVSISVAPRFGISRVCYWSGDRCYIFNDRELHGDEQLDPKYAREEWPDDLLYALDAHVIR